MTWQASELLRDALQEDGAVSLPAGWRAEGGADAHLHGMLDRVLGRKRVACAQKLQQIEAMRDALAGSDHRCATSAGCSLTGERVGGDGAGIDVDGIFLIEKRDKAYQPRDKAWHRMREWK